MTPTIPVPVAALQSLIREVRKAKAPDIKWNESAQIMHERAHKARADSLDEIETELEALLGPEHTPV